MLYLITEIECVLILDMARNKGLIPSGPKEISIQRGQLKAIIESLLPACTEPDIETGVPFKAQAIIANPPAYGKFLQVECLLSLQYNYLSKLVCVVVKLNDLILLYYYKFDIWGFSEPTKFSKCNPICVVANNSLQASCILLHFLSDLPF